MKRELFWFGVVGVSAMLAHFLLVACLLVPAGLPPLLANIVAFLLAFQISYWGHRHKTFEAGHVPHRQALPRFFMVSCLSFALNEAMYFLLLHFTALDYRIALLIVLGSVAVFTFVLSKLWAFSGKAQPV
ncbi:GtrA family protein [Aquitalea palustris]|uniref:GtrA family protein n=1 Tax=Aquitalea palustris TaxID=2480983 RepID=A0A454JJH5_9NEIS|nr:GtrA family protein [Aquitalea palustris]RMC99137.1 GtrA family protein [Aquitalea palustris]